jgi:hypothetical protein
MVPGSHGVIGSAVTEDGVNLDGGQLVSFYTIHLDSCIACIAIQMRA